jgi:hypothetical protein
MLRPLMIAVLLSLPVAAVAQNASLQSQPPERIRSILLKPGETCPPARDANEVVVCAPIEAPYRIPREFRQAPYTPASNSWVNRVETIDQVSRVNGAVPGSCSVVGSAGFSGCVQQMIQNWAAERRQTKKDAPGER